MHQYTAWKLSITLSLSLSLSGCANIMSGQEIKIEEDLEKLMNWNSKALGRYNGREEENGRKKGESGLKWNACSIRMREIEK